MDNSYAIEILKDRITNLNIDYGYCRNKGNEPISNEVQMKINELQKSISLLSGTDKVREIGKAIDSVVWINPKTKKLIIDAIHKAEQQSEEIIASGYVMPDREHMTYHLGEMTAEEVGVAIDEAIENNYPSKNIIISIKEVE